MAEPSLAAKATRPAVSSSGEAQGSPLGAGLAVVAGLVAGVVMAIMLKGFGPYYVPMLMPVLIGWGVGTAVFFVISRFPDTPLGASTGSTVFGAMVAYATYHVLRWSELMDLLAAKLPSLVERAAADPHTQVQLWLEDESRQEGLWAYLSFVSEGWGAGAHPLGLLGTIEPGLSVTTAAIALEALVAVGTATLFFLWRSGALDGDHALGHLWGPAPVSERIREVLTRTDAATLSEALHAVERGHYEEAGRILGQRSDDALYVVALTHAPHGADDHLLEVFLVTDSGGLGELKTSRRISSWDGHAIQDELKLLQAP